MTESTQTRRTVLASTATAFSTIVMAPLVGAVGTASARSPTARIGTIPPYPDGEAPEPDPAWVSDHEDATAEWIEASDEIAPDDEFVWMHDADLAALAGVQLNYGESVEFAELVIDFVVESVEGDIEDVTDDIEGADKAYYYVGFGLDNHLYVRDANAMIDVRAAQLSPGGEYEPSLDTSVLVAEAMLAGIEADRETDDDDDDGWF